MNLNLNLKEFLKYLSRFKWLLIVVPILCVGLAYFLSKKAARKYVSDTLIATGITNQFQQTLTEGQNLDYFKISQRFGNLLEMIKSRRMISALSYELILHDLKNPKEAFIPVSGVVKEYTPDELNKLIQEYQQRLDAHTLISIADNAGMKLYDILKSKRYDEESILKNLSVARNGESDFIKLSYISNNPRLSAFVVNTLADNFIDYYTNMSTAGERKSLAILDTVLRTRQVALERKGAALTYSAASSNATVKNEIVAQKKSDMAYQQITEAQSQRNQTMRTISSLEGAITEIDQKLKGAGGYLTPGALTDNSEIVRIDNQLKTANRNYINNNFQASDKRKIDSLQEIRTSLITAASKKGNTNPAVIRQNLIEQRIKLENDLASAKSTLNTIDRQLNALQSTAGPIVAATTPDNSAGQALARDVEIASKDYADAQEKYQQAELASKTGVNLAVVEPGVPGPPEPSKTLLFAGLAGFSGLMISLVGIFLTFALNKTSNTPQELEIKLHQHVLGWLNDLGEEDKDLRKIWKDKGSTASYSVYKDALRSLRFELNKFIKPGKNVIGITSVLPGEGKTFVAGSLSYAFAMMGKNVLVICEKNDSISDLVIGRRFNEDPPQKFESFLVKKEIQIEDRITILNKNASSSSLLELRDGRSLEAGFKILKETFDVIVVDIGSAYDIYNMKEWLMFCDYSIAVFEAGNKVAEKHHDVAALLSSYEGFLGWTLNKVKIQNVKGLVEKM
ncbi:hypothetical protein A8C56_05070 [Niabella ginsenosidivorans]|uniref:Polysaccharide chain length determinant N-terminal domain-containing protein n=1 Tax=Niabella ginsenosidivorans TaxID=1176587 RepID=A0A1A9I1K6_9BACT|nr:Wzz/FepE/Etk N-terminal domain-containing protein [Niabella ginsenosidivorans]ANH80444.1 hypothetical protein A8C56_05070 [Niabella ginsenosidivorans]